MTMTDISTLDEIPDGAVNQVNVHLFVLTMPFGGVGADGMGHYSRQVRL